MMELVRTDILIVGGGPAGCSAALNAMNIGLKSVLIERTKFPRDKVCGDGVLIHDTSFVLDKYGINLLDIIPDKELITTGFIIADKNDQLDYETPCLMIKRYKFDQIIWDLIPSQSATNIKFEETSIISMTMVDSRYEVEIKVQDKLFKIIANYIIGADGYSSFVRRTFFKSLKFESRIASRFYMKSEKEIKTSMFFDSKVNPGYFWCFKMSDNTYNTGVYLSDQKEDIFELHKWFLSSYFGENIKREEFSTWPIPNNTKLDNLVSGGVLLVGDAAGLCDKLFGHGIDNALLSGYLSIMSIKDSLKETNIYPLSEIYRYKLANAMDYQLTKSYNSYKVLRNNEINPIDLFKNELNSRNSII